MTKEELLEKIYKRPLCGSYDNVNITLIKDPITWFAENEQKIIFYINEKEFEKLNKKLFGSLLNTPVIIGETTKEEIDSRKFLHIGDYVFKIVTREDKLERICGI